MTDRGRRPVARVHPAVPDPSPWTRPRPAGELRARVACLPHAGGGASVFAGWEALLPAGVELVAAQLPGRESRLAEPVPDDLTSLVDELAATLDVADGVPLIVFGHSFGAVLALELALRFRGHGGPAVSHLIVSGAPAPHHRPSPTPMSNLPRDQLLAALDRLGGIPSEVLARRDLVDLVLPAVRADLRLDERYRPVPGRVLGCPITVFGGAADPLVPPTSLEGWEDYTTATCRRMRFPGGHLFHVTARDDVVAAIGAIAGRAHR